MPNLKDLYEKSNIANVVDARLQSQGGRVVNSFDRESQFSKEFTARTPGDSVNVDSGDGTFTERSLNYYKEEFDQFKVDSPAAAKFNGLDQRTYYSEVNKEALGVINRSQNLS